MARITVEDCLEQVENRFHLVRVASKRARQIMNGKEPTLEWDNDKATVLALREIAAGNITEEMLEEKPVINEDEGIFDQSGNSENVHFKEMMNKMKENGLIAKPTHGNIIRFAPPLVINSDEINASCNIIEDSILEYESSN